MAFKRNINDYLLTLVVLTLPSIVATLDCNGKPFHCVNSTHFMICVDFGSGVSSTMDDFIIPCPPTTVCQATNRFECELASTVTTSTTTTKAPVITKTVPIHNLDIVTESVNFVTIPFEEYFNTISTTTLSEVVVDTTESTITDSNSMSEYGNINGSSKTNNTLEVTTEVINEENSTGIHFNNTIKVNITKETEGLIVHYQNITDTDHSDVTQNNYNDTSLESVTKTTETNFSQTKIEQSNILSSLLPSVTEPTLFKSNLDKQEYATTTEASMNMQVGNKIKDNITRTEKNNFLFSGLNNDSAKVQNFNMSELTNEGIALIDYTTNDFETPTIQNHNRTNVVEMERSKSKLAESLNVANPHFNATINNSTKNSIESDSTYSESYTVNKVSQKNMSHEFNDISKPIENAVVNPKRSATTNISIEFDTLPDDNNTDIDYAKIDSKSSSDHSNLPNNIKHVSAANLKPKETGNMAVKDAILSTVKNFTSALITEIEAVPNNTVITLSKITTQYKNNSKTEKELSDVVIENPAPEVKETVTDMDPKQDLTKNYTGDAIIVSHSPEVSEIITKIDPKLGLIKNDTSDVVMVSLTTEVNEIVTEMDPKLVVTKINMSAVIVNPTSEEKETETERDPKLVSTKNYNNDVVIENPTPKVKETVTEMDPKQDLTTNDTSDAVIVSHSPEFTKIITETYPKLVLIKNATSDVVIAIPTTEFQEIVTEVDPKLVLTIINMSDTVIVNPTSEVKETVPERDPKLVLTKNYKNDVVIENPTPKAKETVTEMDPIQDLTTNDTSDAIIVSYSPEVSEIKTEIDPKLVLIKNDTSDVFIASPTTEVQEIVTEVDPKLVFTKINMSDAVIVNPKSEVKEIDPKLVLKKNYNNDVVIENPAPKVKETVTEMDPKQDLITSNTSDVVIVGHSPEVSEIITETDSKLGLIKNDTRDVAIVSSTNEVQEIDTDKDLKQVLTKINVSDAVIVNPYPEVKEMDTDVHLVLSKVEPTFIHTTYKTIPTETTKKINITSYKEDIQLPLDAETESLAFIEYTGAFVNSTAEKINAKVNITETVTIKNWSYLNNSHNFYENITLSNMTSLFNETEISETINQDMTTKSTSNVINFQDKTTTVNQETNTQYSESTTEDVAASSTITESLINATKNFNVHEAVILNEAGIVTDNSSNNSIAGRLIAADENNISLGINDTTIGDSDNKYWINSTNQINTLSSNITSTDDKDKNININIKEISNPTTLDTHNTTPENSYVETTLVNLNSVTNNQSSIYNQTESEDISVIGVISGNSHNSLNSSGTVEMTSTTLQLIPETTTEKYFENETHANVNKTTESYVSTSTPVQSFTDLRYVDLFNQGNSIKGVVIENEQESILTNTRPQELISVNSTNITIINNTLEETSIRIGNEITYTTTELVYSTQNSVVGNSTVNPISVSNDMHYQTYTKNLSGREVISSYSDNMPFIRNLLVTDTDKTTFTTLQSIPETTTRNYFEEETPSNKTGNKTTVNKDSKITPVQLFTDLFYAVPQQTTSAGLFHNAVEPTISLNNNTIYTDFTDHPITKITTKPSNNATNSSETPNIKNNTSFGLELQKTKSMPFLTEVDLVSKNNSMIIEKANVTNNTTFNYFKATPEIAVTEVYHNPNTKNHQFENKPFLEDHNLSKTLNVSDTQDGLKGSDIFSEGEAGLNQNYKKTNLEAFVSEFKTILGPKISLNNTKISADDLIKEVDNNVKNGTLNNEPDVQHTQKDLTPSMVTLIFKEKQVVETFPKSETTNIKSPIPNTSIIAPKIKIALTVIQKWNKALASVTNVKETNDSNTELNVQTQSPIAELLLSTQVPSDLTKVFNQTYLVEDKIKNSTESKLNTFETQYKNISHVSQINATAEPTIQKRKYLPIFPRNIVGSLSSLNSSAISTVQLSFDVKNIENKQGPKIDTDFVNAPSNNKTHSIKNIALPERYIFPEENVVMYKADVKVVEKQIIGDSINQETSPDNVKNTIIPKENVVLYKADVKVVQKQIIGDSIKQEISPDNVKNKNYMPTENAAQNARSILIENPNKVKTDINLRNNTVDSKPNNYTVVVGMVNSPISGTHSGISASPKSADKKQKTVRSESVTDEKPEEEVSENPEGSENIDNNSARSEVIHVKDVFTSKPEQNNILTKILDYRNNSKVKLQNSAEVTTKRMEEPNELLNSNINIEVPTFKENSPIQKTFRKSLDSQVSNSKPQQNPQTESNEHTTHPPAPGESKNDFVCKLNDRGRFSDKTDCRKFYFCIGKHEPISGICPNNTVFSELRKQCTKNLSHCVRNNQFHCISEGRFSDYLNDSIYYICVKSKAASFIRFKLMCQNGYHLNKTSVRCVLNNQSNSDSQQSVSDISTSNQSVSAKSEKLVKEKSKEKFECKKEGKFPAVDDCRRYYVCTKISKSEYRQKNKRCRRDDVFNKEKKKCVDADSYECK